MNTKNKENRKNQGPSTRQERRPKKEGRSPNIYQDHERPETRLTR
jgi:hypothetical protein